MGFGGGGEEEEGMLLLLLRNLMPPRRLITGRRRAAAAEAAAAVALGLHILPGGVYGCSACVLWYGERRGGERLQSERMLMLMMMMPLLVATEALGKRCMSPGQGSSFGPKRRFVRF